MIRTVSLWTYHDRCKGSSIWLPMKVSPHCVLNQLQYFQIFPAFNKAPNKILYLGKISNCLYHLVYFFGWFVKCLNYKYMAICSMHFLIHLSLFRCFPTLDKFCPFLYNQNFCSRPKFSVPQQLYVFNIYLSDARYLLPNSRMHCKPSDTYAFSDTECVSVENVYDWMIDDTASRVAVVSYQPFMNITIVMSSSVWTVPFRTKGRVIP